MKHSYDTTKLNHYVLTVVLRPTDVIHQHTPAVCVCVSQEQDMERLHMQQLNGNMVQVYKMEGVYILFIL